uniref:Uncharacterized protein n=1 Tax=Anguilla anguilla TaxID=7936 RepID=A0A0E9XE88_ANGAN
MHICKPTSIFSFDNAHYRKCYMSKCSQKSSLPSAHRALNVDNLRLGPCSRMSNA